MCLSECDERKPYGTSDPQVSLDQAKSRAVSRLSQRSCFRPSVRSNGLESGKTQVYTVHDLYPFLADQIVRRGAARSGLTWHFNRPPVWGLEFEVDRRGLMYEQVVP